MKHTRIFHVALIIAAVFVLPRFVSAQNQLPPWVNDAWRESQYPASEWYIGYSVDNIRQGQTLAQTQSRVENEARQKIAERISVRVKAVSIAETQSQQTKGAGRFDETIRKAYEQIIESSTDVELARVEVVTHHDQANNKIYALARVKASELSGYYVSQIEFYLQSAENELKRAEQFIASDRKGSAQERLAAARKQLDETGKYNALLKGVDYKGDLKRVKDRADAFEIQLDAFETRLREAAPVFIKGTEKINNNPVDIVISGLQTKFTESGCRVAKSEAEAGYVLTVDVNSCQMTPGQPFSYCYACVRSDLVNVKTGKSEARINFTGPKEGWRDMNRACENAFKKSVDAIWKRISEDTEVCR